MAPQPLIVMRGVDNSGIQKKSSSLVTVMLPLKLLRCACVFVCVCLTSLAVQRYLMMSDEDINNERETHLRVSMPPRNWEKKNTKSNDQKLPLHALSS